MNRDAMVGLVCLMVSVLLYSTLGLIDEPRAVIFPRFIIIIMGLLSALLVLQALMTKTDSEKKRDGYPWFRFLILFSIILAYLAVSETLGFYLSAFLFFVGVTFVLGRANLSKKTATTRLIGSIAFTGVLFLLFNVILEVQTPRGLLF